MNNKLTIKSVVEQMINDREDKIVEGFNVISFGLIFNYILEEQAINSKNINSSIREASAKKVVTTQNQLQSASESAVIARKQASAVSSEFNAKKTLLETTAKEANTLKYNSATKLASCSCSSYSWL